MNEKRVPALVAGLCQGRHELPVEKYIFPQVVEDPMDFAGMEDRARDFLNANGLGSGDALIVYVTGLTPCLTSVINACLIRNVRLALMHYDRVSETYLSQRMETYIGEEAEM